MYTTFSFGLFEPEPLRFREDIVRGSSYFTDNERYNGIV